MTPNGLTPAAPDPRKFSSSPVGKRTSTPAATPNFSPWYTSYLPRSVMSPMPDAEFPSEKVALRQGEAEPQLGTSFGSNWWNTPPGKFGILGATEFGTIAAVDVVF